MKSAPRTVISGRAGARWYFAITTGLLDQHQRGTWRCARGLVAVNRAILTAVVLRRVSNLSGE